MSLLLKALQNAAKNREGGGTGTGGDDVPPADAASEGASELRLEPIEQKTADSTLPAEPAARQRPGADAASRLNDRNGTASRSQAQNILRASAVRDTPKGSSPGIMEWMARRPLVAFSTAAGLFAIGPGGGAQPPAAPGSIPPAGTSTPPTVAPAPAAAAATTPTSTAPAPAPAASGPVPSAVPPAAGPAVKPTAPPIAVAATPREPVPAARPAAGRPAASRPPTAPTAAPVALAAQSDLNNAYQALQKGQLNEAERLYRQVLATDARNVDAMLGLASVHAQQNRGDTATQLYMRVLEVDPRNSYAQAGLLNLGGKADPAAAETRLKQLIARDPSAYLYFTLGNLYAEQNQWSAAQGAYFQAFNLAPDNPDYAFNLAVGLEHLSQPKLALDYYRRAVSLAQTRGSAQFALPPVQARIRGLEAVLAERP